MVAPERAEPGKRTGESQAVPGWALVLRSPFDAHKTVTSWFGGVPRAPDSFKWPGDRDGTPLAFLAQIDLADIEPEATTGQRPAGLPESGAILVFVGKACSVHVLTKEEMAQATRLTPPASLPPLHKHHFFSNEQTFPFWPMDLVAFLDHGDEPPAAFPDRFAKPEDWIVNWGIAALETQTIIDKLDFGMRDAASFLERFEKHRSDREQAGEPPPSEPVLIEKYHYYTLISAEAPSLMSALTDWREIALSQSQVAPVDRDQLSEIFRKRLEFHDKLTVNYGLKGLLPGNARAVWENKIREYCNRFNYTEDFIGVPPAYRPFVSAQITNWRRHRLFGIEPPFPNNFEDTKGKECIVSVAADMLLGTCSEHEYGMSIWCSRHDVKRGRYHRGKFIRHCAV